MRKAHMQKILPLKHMRELHMDGYISRHGWKLHTTDLAVDDDQQVITSRL